jgi:tetratricopeptide (TPR) repeat protein
MTPEAGRSLLMKHWRAVQAALIVLAGAAVYSNTFHVQFVLDDYARINFHGSRELLEILLHGGSRRVADFTFALNYRLHGLGVTGYHLVNLAVHISAALTLYFLIASAVTALRQSFPHNGTLQDDKRCIERFVPLASALLFVLHPVQTQAVTYIIQRYTSLSALFYLLSALFFVRARIALEKDGRLSRVLLTGTAALAAGQLAIWSKQTAATLPLMLIALEITLFRGRLLNRRFLIAAGCLALGIILTARHGWQAGDLLDHLERSTTEDRFIGRTTYFLTQVRVVATYLRMLCLPYGQSLFYDYPVYNSLFSLPVVVSLALHVTLMIAALLLFRQSARNLGSDEHPYGILQRLASLGVAWFYIAMIVESSIFPITDIIFEHRIYLPSAGFFLALSSLTALAAIHRHGGVKRINRLCAAVCLVLGFATITRNNVWGDTMALWQDTVRKAPHKDLAQANLAGEFMRLNQPEKALPLFVRSLELNPRCESVVNIYLGKTLQSLNVDIALFTTGEELSSYEKTDISPEDRIKMECIMFNNLGLAYEYLGELLKARVSYRTALRIDPSYHLAWYNLGLLAVRTGDRAQFAAALTELRKIKPYLADQLVAASNRQP